MITGMKRKYEKYEESLIRVPLLTFLESYNLNLPKGFPRATVGMLQKFHGLYPVLFKHGDTWSIARHRKRLIDWLSSNRMSV